MVACVRCLMRLLNDGLKWTFHIRHPLARRVIYPIVLYDSTLSSSSSADNVVPLPPARIAHGCTVNTAAIRRVAPVVADHYGCRALETFKW